MNGYALVIGIDDYETLPKLENAVNDATEVADALEKLGFIVDKAINLSLDEFHQRIDRFDSDLKGFDVGVVFFAGHGFQQEGINFLAGKEFIPGSTFIMKKDGVTLDDVIEKMRVSGVETKIIILDACRKEFQDGTRGIASNSLVSVFAPKGTLIAFSTSPGEGAKDGEGQKHSHYTSAFLTHIKDEHIPIEEFFKRVRTTLSTATNGKQTSWEHTSLIGQFKFNNGKMRHSKDLPYDDAVVADQIFRSNHTGSEIDVALTQLSGDWDDQNAAIIKLQRLGIKNMDADHLFLLGRGLVNGGENNAFKITDILRDLPNWLVAQGGGQKHHILNGMLYEIYFNSKGLIRRKNNKTKWLDEIFRLENDARFSASFDMINDQLQPFRDRLVYIPSKNPNTLPIDLQVEDVLVYEGLAEKKITSINVYGKSITVSTEGEDKVFTGRRLTFDEFKTLLSNELIIPKDRITINPPDIKSYLLNIPFSYSKNRTTEYLFEQELVTD
ncbi:MAG: caspase family protein [Bacteroidetes bacterium]|nr:caspase family protein [Bacteroidota bacterium]